MDGRRSAVDSDSLDAMSDIRTGQSSDALKGAHPSRREAMAVLSAGVAASLLPGCNMTPSETAAALPGDDAAKTVLDGIGEHLLARAPETATTLGLDTDARRVLRSQLADRSRAGQDALAALLRTDLAQAEAIDTRALKEHATRTTVEVVKSAYRTALEGFALPYGDVAVGGWRNTPYVVIQNVGAYIDTPRFLDTDHPIENRTDAEAYLSRLAQYPHQLDGEFARMRAARGKGLVPPTFLIDKAVNQLGISLEHSGRRDLVDSLVRRTKEKGIAGDWDARARKIATAEGVPALQRQLTELQAERTSATDDAGMWSRPHGDEFYRWALKRLDDDEL